MDLALFSDERIKRIFRGAKRIVGIPSTRPRKEITKDILLAILLHLDTNLYDDLNIYAAFCTAFAAFLRCGEFTWDIWTPDAHLRYLSRNSVRFDATGDSISLHLPASKTDPFCHGTVIPLARSPDASCPVTALSLLLTRYPSHSPDDPLFSRACGPFSHTWVLTRLHTLLLAAGIDPTGYSGHSFRRGAVNTAITMGISKDDIRDLGRWKSNAIDRYISSSTTHSTLLALSHRLHSRSGPSTSVSAPVGGSEPVKNSQAFEFRIPHSQDRS